ncbi:MAG: hypothetical protein IJM24_01005 [Clostridia bacterium]|nr:hypothetical protein [Clostridia bacterium]
MNDVDRALTERSAYLKGVLISLDSDYADLPDGSLYKVFRNGKAHYYFRARDGSGKLRYIKAEDRGLLRVLAQRKYVDELRSSAEAEAEAINAYRARLPSVCVEEICDKMDENLRGMIDPVIDNDLRFALRWERENCRMPACASREANTNGEANTHEANTRGDVSSREAVNVPDGNETDLGEIVRSKSECLIANMLHRNGILYRYEKPLRIGEAIFHPDFTILDVRGRREIIYEHFGKMGNPDYADNAVNKLTAYNRAGYILGDRLLVSMETDSRPLNIRSAERMVLRALGML